MRKILSGVVDRDSLFEITPYFGRGMITAFARLNGFSVESLQMIQIFMLGQ